MTYLHSGLFASHILFGSLALILFWVPLFTKKGQLNHTRFGNHYKVSMYLVALSGAIMALMVLAFPVVIKGEYINNASNPERATYVIRLFWAFLLYLSLLSFTVTRHATAVIAAKQNRKSLQKLSYLLPIIALITAAPVLFYYGFIASQTLLMVFAVLGLVVGFGMLRYCIKAQVAERQWLFEHIGSFIGSGIGAYTAFIAFGARTVFEGLGAWQIIFWIAPGLIGSIASAFLCKKYGKLYGIKPVITSKSAQA
ncbi:hypothetical protein ISG33_15925 [Glaciecola sp. MH2013]|uniref:SoxR reducing system RseC family protein n=1 Tax=Glaciecola sp. MH2013 TaxID=2785524 RepID=UPI00189DDD91|nr:SoxR reducing system RseC family protein [Glaciecola sp. MH2013]MBF7074891.1 hypothetical protein [Glaciecola sp. MH2013]